MAFTGDGYAASVRQLCSRSAGGAALPAPLPGRPRRPRVPPAVRGRDRGDQPRARHPCPASRHHRPRRRHLHHVHPRPARDAATRERPPKVSLMTSIEDLNPELKGIGRYEFGWSDAERRRRRRAARPQRGRRPQHLLAEDRAAVDARPAAEGPEALRPQADAHLGRRPVGDRLRQHQVLRALHREAGRHLGRPARGHQEHLRQARHPRGGEAAPRLRRRRAVRVRGRLPLDPRGPRGAGRALPRHRHRAEGARRSSSRSTSAPSSRSATTSSPR